MSSASRCCTDQTTLLSDTLRYMNLTEVADSTVERSTSFIAADTTHG